MSNLLRKYKEAPHKFDTRQRDQLIVEYAPLIKFIAQKIAVWLPSNIDLDDLISAGVIGLMDAIEKMMWIEITNLKPMRNLEFGGQFLMN